MSTGKQRYRETGQQGNGITEIHDKRKPEVQRNMSWGTRSTEKHEVGEPGVQRNMSSGNQEYRET
jgi:hypothetical protein